MYGPRKFLMDRLVCCYRFGNAALADVSWLGEFSFLFIASVQDSLLYVSTSMWEKESRRFLLRLLGFVYRWSVVSFSEHGHLLV